MKIIIPVQELSDGRLRNVITGKVVDSLSEIIKDEDFKESQHPRDKGGKFSSKGGESVSKESVQKTLSNKSPDSNDTEELNGLQSEYEKYEKISDKDKRDLDDFVSSLKEKYGSGMDEEYNWLYQKNMTPDEKKEHDEYMSKWQKSAGKTSSIARELWQKKEEYKEQQKKQQKKEEEEKNNKEFNKKIKSGEIHPFNKTVRNIIKKGKYNQYGIRVVSDNPKTGDEDTYTTGEIAKPSYEWENGESKSNRKLSGTSAIKIDPNDEDYLSKVARYWGNGDQVILLGSDNYEVGNDPGETVMKRPKVLAVLNTANVKRPEIKDCSIYKECDAMEIKIPVQELSDGRFRNVITGKIGDSVREITTKKSDKQR